MKLIKAILKITFLISLTISCNGQDKKIIMPKNLDEGILYFEQNWTKTDLDEFKNKDENTALAEVDFGAALWVRNNWIRGDRNKEFTKYFNDLGVFSPDDISSILFTSLHRKLNNKEIELENQIENYKKYWSNINECEENQKEKAINYYKQYKENDTVNIYMPVDTSSNFRNAIIYVCPTIEWNFNSSKDLKFSAIIVNKYFINNKSNVFFKLKILKMNFPNTEILMQNVLVGDEIDLNLNGLKID